jgi:environmental stress-induced protein Ves
VPWKNGGGVTHEAVRVPVGGDSFDWRVSVARIDAAGPFSEFADHHRVMVLLQGAGVLLRFSGGPAPLVRELRRAGDMEEFDGGVATHCELIDGPCVDLNLMVAKRLRGVRARVEALRGERSFRVAGHDSMLVFPIDAGIELRRGETTDRLGPWDLALLSGQEEQMVHIAATRSAGTRGAVSLFVATIPQQ